MPTSWTQNFNHAVFSTKNREEFIRPDIEARLCPFIGGIIRDLGCSLLKINCMPDHIHVLVRYPSDLSHSDMLRHMKSRSSKWIHEEFRALRSFAWQEGYGGFTGSESMVSAVDKYIANQKEHHKQVDFKTEFLRLLRRHGIEFDEADVFN